MAIEENILLTIAGNGPKDLISKINQLKTKYDQQEVHPSKFGFEFYPK